MGSLYHLAAGDGKIGGKEDGVGPPAGRGDLFSSSFWGRVEEGREDDDGRAPQHETGAQELDGGETGLFGVGWVIEVGGWMGDFEVGGMDG